MDFAYGEEQEAVKELADRIFTERSTPERLKAVEAAADDASGPFDRDLWADLAGAGLLGIGLPEDVGGAGLDFVAVCLVVEAAGRTAARQHSRIHEQLRTEVQGGLEADAVPGTWAEFRIAAAATVNGVRLAPIKRTRIAYSWRKNFHGRKGQLSTLSGAAADALRFLLRVAIARMP